MLNPDAGAARRKRPAGFSRLGLCFGLAATTFFGLVALPESAPGSAGTTVPVPIQTPDGKKIYGTVCGACHQAGGTGVQGMYPPLAGSEWVTGDEGRLIRIVLHGLTGKIEVKGTTYSSTMPPFGSALKDAEVAAVATYIRGNFGNKAPAVKPATVARVRAATASRKKPWTAGELTAATRAPAKN